MCARSEERPSVLIHYSYTTNKKKCPFSLVAGARASLPALLHLPPFEAARPARTNALKRPLQARLQALRPGCTRALCSKLNSRSSSANDQKYLSLLSHNSCFSLVDPYVACDLRSRTYTITPLLRSRSSSSSSTTILLPG